MLTEPLPNTLDLRKAAARGVTVSGLLNTQNLERLTPLLAVPEGSVKAELTCSRDEENRYLVRVSITADVSVICQRCLDTMPKHLSGENLLAVVWTDEQAAHLPRHLDPLIVAGEVCDLWELVEEELILALPSFNYHHTQDCKIDIAGLPEADLLEETVADKPNPFNVLAQLKPGRKQ